MRKRLGMLFVVTSMMVCGCSASSDSGKHELKLENPYYAGYQALDAGSWEEAIGLFEEALSGEEQDYIALLGLAKAQMGAEQMEEARETLLEARTRYPEEPSAMAYLGEVSMRLESYKEAADNFYHLVKVSEDNEQARTKLTDALWKTDAYEWIYDVSKELYQMYPENKDYLRKYVWSCACLGDEEHVADVLETVKGSDDEYVVNLVIEAYQKAKSGDMEGARAQLFDSKHEEEISKAWRLYYGDVTDGVGQGLAVGIQNVFGRRGAFIGQERDGMWDGTGEAWYGYSGTTTRTRNDVKYEGMYYRDLYFSGEWKQGIPEGEVQLVETYHWEYGGYPGWVGDEKSETMLTFVQGKAEGRTETYKYVQESDGTWDKRDYVEIHEFMDGEAQPFLAKTEDGEKMVYELSQYPDGDSWYQETDCGCSYIWSE